MNLDADQRCRGSKVRQGGIPEGEFTYSPILLALAVLEVRLIARGAFNGWGRREGVLGTCWCDDGYQMDVSCCRV